MRSVSSISCGLLFGEVLVPEAVWHEVVEAGEGRPGAAEARAAVWIEVRHADEEATRTFRDRLDPGEAEAMALATAVHADLLLIDDLAGRMAAADLGMTVVGTLGVLLRAKLAGHLPTVLPVVQAMFDLGFRATPDLLAKVAELAGE